MTRRKLASSLPDASALVPLAAHQSDRRDGFNQIFLELAALKLGVYMPVSYILPAGL